MSIEEKAAVKSKLTDSRKMTIMLYAGIMLALLGVLAGFLLPEEQHAFTRAAGFVTGLGSALAARGGGVLLWHRIIGEKRVRESALAVGDERGQAVAYRAQSATAIAAVLCLAVMIAVAAVRGDMLYMELGTVMCCLLCGVKLLAWHWYNKRM